MKNKFFYMALVIFIAVPAVIWAAQKTVTTYTWDRNIDVHPKSAAGCLNISNDPFACKASGNDRVYIRVYLTDENAQPVVGATVTYSIIRYHQNDTNENGGPITDQGAGWYGGDSISYCGTGNNSWRSNNRFRQTPTVTITATHGSCTITQSIIVGN
ncbi:MAG: hypothetical protein WBJ16_00240 [Smithellaceae bacterium]